MTEERHPDLVRLEQHIRDSIAQGYQHGDVNHLVQPIIGMLRLRQRDGRTLTEQDVEHVIEKLEKACMAENALLAYLHPEKYRVD